VKANSSTKKPLRFSQGFAEIVLIVADVERAFAFYRDVVGLTPETEPANDWAWLWAGAVGEPQRIGLHRGTLLFEEHSPLPPGERFGKVHYAFRVARKDLEAAVNHVQSQGVTVYGPVRFDWMNALSYYFYDPDGNLLEWWSPDDNAAT
jgi:catechol 2,3-dioxygenase-like lactoylglutathione lyase family enzyme